MEEEKEKWYRKDIDSATGRYLNKLASLDKHRNEDSYVNPLLGQGLSSDLRKHWGEQAV